MLWLTVPLILSFFLQSCSQAAQKAASRKVLQVGEVKSISAEFHRLADAARQATIDRDFAAMKNEIYSDDAVHHDGNMELTHSGLGMVSLLKTWITYFPDYGSRPVSYHIGRTDGFYMEESWNWSNVSPNYTQDDPMINYMWFTLREGKISYWWMFYGRKSMERDGYGYDEKLLEDYAAAWSSGDAKTAADLYAADAVRTDSLFEETQQGNAAIQQFASSFFTWYPGIKLTLLNTFAEGPQPIKKGGVYTMSVTDQSGAPCQVEALILLEGDQSEQKITHEWVFYQAESLIKCGWAK